MGVQTVGVEGGRSVQRFLQSPLLVRNDLWCSSNIDSSDSVMNALSSPDEADNRFGHMNSAPGSMNLDDFLKNSEKDQSFSSSSREMANNASSASSLQQEGSIASNNRTSSSKKTADEIWRHIQQSDGGAKNVIAVVKTENDPMTLEDFLTKAGAYTGEEISFNGGMGGLNASHTTRSLSTAHLNLSPSPSIGALSDSTLSESGRKRDPSDPLDRLDRKLRRKIKNRESAARSRARKQAYHNELVSKVSRLEMENMKLKKEKEFEKLSANAVSDETRYQLRRTSSTNF